MVGWKTANLVDRDTPLSFRPCAIIGPRGAGKTCFMLQIARKLMEKRLLKAARVIRTVASPCAA
ncbi:MAG: hypothetical protein FGF53_04540 [Candidatus Brockarchaeota archaeon]|nr:hypothetical protein [Candidatus Brockarchaeota archaeon]MBO3809452.1 hypothetical protein [Candidatus Brockarchaeota archaeon]